MAFRRNRLLPSDYMLSGTLAENPGSALLYGEPGCGKSTLTLKFAWQTQGAFDAGRVSTLRPAFGCRDRGRVSRKLKLGFETRPHEEHIAAIKGWLAERRALLVLDDIWESEVEALVPGPPVSMLCTSRRLIRCCTRNRKRSAWSWAIGRSL
jgi:NB-ARC domain